jgi:Outer membrane protein beta-barrel family/Carboxypeptidase regulatory-like domain
MQKLTILLLFIFAFNHPSFSQKSPLSPKATLKGRLTDSTERKALSNGSVLLLNRSDSTMTGHTRTDKAGNFYLSDIPPGQFLLLITYPAYADYVDELDIKDSSPLTLPPINLILKSKLLEAVVVSGNKGAIHVKGDTMEFRADSFHTQAGATVEDLLKKLPGIQVDKNGKITAQGQTVQKVLVDGEEFFGDDPTLVTQNLRADMIDKVQLYDKKSDQSAFTGIDDGERTKTINLKLKDSKKNGYFGRASAGAGTDSYYDAQLMLNSFRKKQKLAAYGIISNTGKTGLNWQERDNYGQSFAGMLDYDETTGNYSFDGNSMNELDSWNGKYNGQGIPAVKTGGVHYNDKWNDDRQSVNGNYKFMQLAIDDSSTTNSEYILPDTLYYNNQRQQSHNQILRHSADLSYEIKFDSTSSLKIMADGGTDHKSTNSTFISESLARDSSLVNQNNRTVNTVGDNRTINSNLLWRKRFAKKGRTISVNFRENYTNNASTGFLHSNTDFYSDGQFAYDSLIDQYKQYKTENTLLDSKISYSEPLSASSFLVVNYGASLTNSHSDRNSFNKSPVNDKYSQLDSLYSNDYQFNTLSNRGGIAYSLIKKKLRFNAGGNIGFTSFSQHDLRADTSIRRHFVDWYPQASLAYNFTTQRRLSFQYFGNTVQPTLQQIQPVLTNEDPLNITIGNPALKAQFQNRVGLNFFDYQVLTERSIWLNMNYSFTQNAISNQSTVDSTGRRVSQAINVNGNYSLQANLNYDFKWKSPGLNMGVFTSANQSNNVSVVDNLPNTTHSGNYRLGMSINKSKDKKFELGMNAFAMYTHSQSSINTGVTTDYWSYDITPSLDIYFPAKFQFHTDCDINLRQKTVVFTGNNDVTLLNAWLGKKFLKNDALLVKASGNDILNQNIGFNRTVNSNFISQNTYATIKRYFMFSVVWNFNKTGTPAPAER